MKTLSVLFVSSIISLSAMGMGYPTSNSPKAIKKPVSVVEKQHLAAPNVTPEDVRYEAETEQPKSPVNAITKVIVKLFDLSGKLLQERTMSKEELLSGTKPKFVVGSYFATLTNGVAYYFIERKED